MAAAAAAGLVLSEDADAEAGRLAGDEVDETADAEDEADAATDADEDAGDADVGVAAVLRGTKSAGASQLVSKVRSLK